MKRSKTKDEQVFSVRLGPEGRLMLPSSVVLPWWRAGRRVFFCRKDGSTVISAKLITMCSGFRESVVRRVFDHVSLCFCDWESSAVIAESGEVCCLTAASSFANKAKLLGILTASRKVVAVGFDKFKQDVLADPIGKLQSLPYIGPITSWHLAKNLGLDVAKPDRHLVRVSESLGFRDADHLCRELAASTGNQTKVVDLIVWRYVADNPRRFPTTYQ